LNAKCIQTELCMRYIEPEKVYNTIGEIIKE